MDELPGLSIRDLVMEVRESIHSLDKKLDQHLEEFHSHKAQAVTRHELQMFEQFQKTSRRYMITTVVAVVSVVIAATGVILTVLG